MDATWLLAAFAVFGIVLLGAGITGNVVSQSCCFGEACPLEDKCFPPPSQAQDDYTLSFIGLALVLISGAVFVARRK